MLRTTHCRLAVEPHTTKQGRTTKSVKRSRPAGELDESRRGQSLSLPNTQHLSNFKVHAAVSSNEKRNRTKKKKRGVRQAMEIGVSDRSEALPLCAMFVGRSWMPGRECGGTIVNDLGQSCCFTRAYVNCVIPALRSDLKLTLCPVAVLPKTPTHVNTPGAYHTASLGTTHPGRYNIF